MVEQHLWLVFFGPGKAERWWQKCFKRGFRHVSAASYYPAANRWVYYNPGFEGTVIELWTQEESGERLGALLMDSTVVLRFPSRLGRHRASSSYFCVGAIKALLGVRTCALSPLGLMRHLLRAGAEIVENDIGQSLGGKSTETGRAA